MQGIPSFHLLLDPTFWPGKTPLLANLFGLPHRWVFLKANFDVAIRNGLAVAATVLSDSNGNIIAVVSKKHSLVDVNVCEAHATSLAVGLALSFGLNSLFL